MKPIPEDKIDGIKKGDWRYLWYKGDVRKVEVKSTYNEPNGEGICVDYELKTCCGNLWVNINKLFLTEQECIETHISNLKSKYNKTIANLNTQATQKRGRIIAIKRDSAESPNPPTADFS